MSKMPFGLGNCSCEYLYILGVALLKLLEDYLLSLEDVNSNLKKNIFGIKMVLKQHKLIRVLYSYMSCFIFGYIFYKISKKIRQNKDKQKNQKTAEMKSARKLIYKKFTPSRQSKILLLIVSAVFPLQIVIRKLISFYKVGDLDLWIFNIFFLSIFMHYFLGYNIYKHQKYSLIFIYITNLCLLVYGSFIPKIKGKDSSIKMLGFLSILLLFVYIILSCASSSSKVLFKYLMDLKYMSPYKLIYIMGIFGFFFTLITLIITSSINCQNIQNRNNCKVYNNQTKLFYYDSIPIYFSNLHNKIKTNKTSFFVEIIIVTPIILFVNFAQFTFNMLIILYLNPNYILINDCLYYSVKKLLEFIKDPSSYYLVKFIVEYIAEMLAILGYMIYLEIIELRFCGLDSDIKKHIIDRSIRDGRINVGGDIKWLDTFNSDCTDDDESDGNVKSEGLSVEMETKMT